MISLEDCIGLCGLNEDEIAAIAEHEHAPEIQAAAIGNYLLHKPGGALQIRTMLIEDIRNAARGGDYAHAATLLRALRHFIQHHGGELHTNA